MTQQAEQTILTGVATGYYAPKQNEESGRWSPHKFLVDTGEEEVELSVFAKDDGTLPTVLAGLDINNILGKKVQAIAVWKSEFKGRKQYKPTQIKIMGGSPPPSGVLYPGDAYTSQESAPAPAKILPGTNPAPEFIASGMTRSEYGMAKGNAISAATALISAHVSKTGKLPTLEFIEEAAGLINSGSQAILSGRIAEVEEEDADEGEEPDNNIEDLEAPDPMPRQQSLGIIQLDDGAQS